MREHLYRGKRRDNGEWVYGSIIAGDYILQYIDLAQSWTPNTSDHKLTCRAYDIVPETVGQYTGFTDKNKKPIYEGDIIMGTRSCMRSRGYKSNKYPDRISVVCVVKYDVWHAGWVSEEIGPIKEHLEADANVPYHYYQTSLTGSDGHADWVEVIGNKFDNPELLNQQ